jgi:hypothetical protein
MKTKVNIERQSFATLDLAIADDCLVISESGGPISCYDIQFGELKWRIRIDEDGHFPRVAILLYLSLVHKHRFHTCPNNRKYRFSHPQKLQAFVLHNQVSCQILIQLAKNLYQKFELAFQTQQVQLTVRYMTLIFV